VLVSSFISATFNVNYIYIYITRKECGDTVANYGCNKAVVDNTRIKNINYRTFRLPMGSLLQRFSTIYNEFQNYSSENELLNHACFHFVLSFFKYYNGFL